MTTPIALSMPPESQTGWGLLSGYVRRSIGGYVDAGLPDDDSPVGYVNHMLHGIQGVNMLPMKTNRWSWMKNVGFSVFEESENVKRYIANANRYFDHVCTGSTWCGDILKANGVPSVSVALPGADIAYFTPATEKATRDDRFVIFSGGKAEYRKGIDIAMKAIGIMMQRHSDVHAIGNWYNPWQFSMDTMGMSQILPWAGSIRQSMHDAGIDMDRMSGYWNSPFKHESLVDLYRASDVGVFPNRCEGGANNVLLEFMACGKPVISMHEHSHADIVRKKSPLTLSRITRSMVGNVLPDGTQRLIGEYYDPDLDEVVEKLEFAYRNRTRLDADGIANNKAVQKFTWASFTDQLMQACQ